MSFILDALKKSDQERQKGNGPSLQTIHRPFQPDSNENSFLKWILALLLLLVSLFGISLWIYLTTNEGKPNKQISIVQQGVDQEATSNTASTPTQAQSINNSVAEPIDEASLLDSKTGTALPNQAAIRFNDLDAIRRSEIPSLTFSFHVYSDNPERRTIIINNRRVREGDLVEKGLILEEITQLGVIFIWKQTTRFSIDVVESW